MSTNFTLKDLFPCKSKWKSWKVKGSVFVIKKRHNCFSAMRFRAYTYPFQDNSVDGDHLFVKDDICFEDIREFYQFDRDLRSLLFNVIARIEVSIISNLRNCCAHHGRVWNKRFMVQLVLPYNTSRHFMDRNF